MALVSAFLVGCDRRAFWEYYQAGVLTTPDSRQYLVVNPCLERQQGASINYIELSFADRFVVDSGEKIETKTVIKYKVDPTLPLNKVVAPLDPEESPPPGIELEFVDEELLAEALKSEPSSLVPPSVSSDEMVILDTYYVEGGGEGSYIGTWNSSLNKRDSFASGEKTKAGIEGNGCEFNGIRLEWVIPPPPDERD